MSTAKARNLGVCFLVLGMSMLLAGPALASAVTFNVQTTADGNQSSPGTTSCASNAETAAGKCTLRSSIEAADNEPQGTDVTINVPAGTYKLTVPNESCVQNCAPINSYSLNVLSGPNSVTITGAGATSTIVDANFLDRAFDLNGGPTVSISGMTIEHGRSGGIGNVSSCPTQSQADADGGGILAQGVLNLTAVRLTDNIASGGGGGLADTGSDELTVSGSTFSNNQACQSSTLFASRNGGGIDVNGDSTVFISSSVITGNSAVPSGNGGGLDLESGGPTVQVTTTTISGNSAFSGAGISNDAGGQGTYFADTISGNQASNNGGGFQDDNGGTERFVDTTVAGNTAPSDGGGIWEGGTGTISFSTISKNSAAQGTGNLSNGGEAGGTVNLDDSIVVSPTAGSNCSFGITDNGYNMFDDTSDQGSQCGSSSGKHDVITSMPKVGPLANNGGQTETAALLSGSPAIDAASDALCRTEPTPPGAPVARDGRVAVPVDQRFISRPQGPHCDIGAFEATPDVGVSGSVAQDPIFTGQQDTVTWTVGNSNPSDAENTTFTDPAAGYRIRSVTPSQGSCTHTTTSVTCHLGLIPPGGHVTINVVVIGLTPGTLTLNGATATTGSDLNSANNHATVRITVKKKKHRKPPPPPPPPPHHHHHKPPRPTITIHPLARGCYATGTTIHPRATAIARAGIRQLLISVSGHGFSQGEGLAVAGRTPVHRQTFGLAVKASRLLAGRTYSVVATVTDELGRRARDHAHFTICNSHSGRGFTG